VKRIRFAVDWIRKDVEYGIKKKADTAAIIKKIESA
jgi:hypothetical protein